MVDMRFLFKQMPRNRSLTRPWLVEIKTNLALMTGTPQYSLHATMPRSAVWRVACKLNPCTQALRMGDERFLSNVFKCFLFLLRFLRFLTFFIFFWTFFTSMYSAMCVVVCILLCSFILWQLYGNLFSGPSKVLVMVLTKKSLLSRP